MRRTTAPAGDWGIAAVAAVTGRQRRSPNPAPRGVEEESNMMSENDVSRRRASSASSGMTPSRSRRRSRRPARSPVARRSAAVPARSARCMLSPAGAGARRLQPREHLRPAEEVQVRVRQPRDDEPVLHADAVRHPRRMRAARLHATSGPARRRATSAQMVTAFNTRDHRRRRRHRLRDDRPEGVHRADRQPR